MPAQPQWNAISFSSSGVLLVGQMGIYCQLREAGLLNTVKDYYGCSGGSICAYLGALGVTPAWIREWVQHFDTRPIINIQEDMIIDYMTTWGVDSGVQAAEYIGKFVDTWEPGASQWTFADLQRARPGISLTITATNVSAGCQGVFSIERSPSMRIADAIRASSSVPFYASPWADPSGQLFCDGAVIESYPRQCVKSVSDTLFVVCEGPPSPPNISSLGEYIHRVMRIARFKNHKAEDPDHIIYLKNCGIMLLNFMISKEERLRVFASGLSDAAAWITRVSPAGTEGTPPCSGDPHTLSVSHPFPESSSDSHLSCSPLPPRAPVQDLPHGRPRRYRRWSV